MSELEKIIKMLKEANIPFYREDGSFCITRLYYPSFTKTYYTIIGDDYKTNRKLLVVSKLLEKNVKEFMAEEIFTIIENHYKNYIERKN